MKILNYYFRGTQTAKQRKQGRSVTLNHASVVGKNKSYFVKKICCGFPFDDPPILDLKALSTLGLVAVYSNTSGPLNFLNNC